MLSDKKSFYFTVYNHIKNGLNPTKIADKYDMSKQQLNYYIAELKRNNYIKKIGYGTWTITNKEVKEVKKVPMVTPTGGRSTSKKKISGHNIVFKIFLPDIPNWDKRVNYMQSRDIDHNIMSNGKYQRIYVNGRKVWLCDKSIVIYTNREYISESSAKSYRLAINDMYRINRKIEKMFNIDIKKKGQYYFKCSRSHFANLNHYFAKHCNRNKIKVELIDNRGIWAYCDASNVDHLETCRSGQEGVSDQDIVLSPFFNTLKKEPYILDKITYNFQLYAENIESHIKAIQDLGTGVNLFNEKLDILTEVLLKLK